MQHDHHPPTSSPWWSDVAHLASERDEAPHREAASRPRGERRPNGEQRRPAAASRDWLEAGARERVPEPKKSMRPRARLVDVEPHLARTRSARSHADRGAALPARRQSSAVERHTRGAANPDRLILWAVGLGILMILASIGTAGLGV